MTVTATHGDIAVLVVAVVFASVVEMVEALTIVLATGLTRGWRSTMQGVVAAVLTLGALIAALGPAIVHYVPLNSLRVVVGALLLVFGLQWLRKAVLRAVGLKAKHDEDEIFRTQVAELSATPRHTGYDGTAFTVAFKGVFLEGLEVVVIVLTLGTAAGRLGVASLAAGVSVVAVAVAGLIVARQLSGVPENALKMSVGVMLVSYGTFWCGEGIGAHWPGGDLAILVLVGVYAAVTAALVGSLRRSRKDDVVPV